MSGPKYWQERALAGVGAEEYPEPSWDGVGVPHCTEDGCANYDGKRCRLMGQRPGELCRPVVEAMAEMLDEQE